ncbi:MAG: type II toxin-antitoxin system RelE/ParE family toxin [Xanthobacteraceae bacterium]|nr:type II toxin-antitoxin system RelE/ParE family toxin [Xanthobacteraceae bacterium]
MTIEWSDAALSDLNRLALFLRDMHPMLAKRVASEIIAKSEVLAEHPRLDRPILGREEYRQVVLQVLNARYVFQYRYDGKRLVVLRVFHGRESRD